MLLIWFKINLLKIFWILLWSIFSLVFLFFSRFFSRFWGSTNLEPFSPLRPHLVRYTTFKYISYFIYQEAPFMLNFNHQLLSSFVNALSIKKHHKIPSYKTRHHSLAKAIYIYIYKNKTRKPGYAGPNWQSPYPHINFQ